MNARLTVWTVLLCSVFGLTACGGGGGSDESPGMQTGTQTPPTIQTPGGPWQLEDGPDPDLQVTSVVSDAFVATLLQDNQIMYFDGTLSCRPSGCRRTLGNEVTEFSIEFLEPDNIEVTDVEIANGVYTGFAEGSAEGLDFQSYGIWNRYFHASHNYVDMFVVDAHISMDLPLVVGEASGSNPVSGSAVWTGRMTGYHTDQPIAMSPPPGSPSNDPQLWGITGDARIEVAFASGDLDVWFSDIIDRQNDNSYPAMYWAKLPIQNGRFSGNGLHGEFFGPEHQEAAGIFNRDFILGAFGTTRQK